jgi:hypothetical protein
MEAADDLEEGAGPTTATSGPIAAYGPGRVPH